MMQRVVSLCLPEFAIERVRRIDRRRPRPDGPPPETAAPALPESEPRGGGWRPGARWARDSGRLREKEAVADAVAALPAHQRPSLQEMGRRSEAAPIPLRAVRSDDAGTSATPGGYDREGSFWQTGRALGGAVKRVVDRPGWDAADMQGAGGLPPLVLTVRDGSRILVGHACPAARAAGIRAGMAMTLARAMVPMLDVRDAEPVAVQADLHRLALFALRRWAPLVAVSDADGLWIDLTGAAHLHGGEARFCRRVLRFCARLGLSARIAVAGTAGAAHALARFGGDRAALLPSGAEAQALASLPIAALRIDPVIDEKLRRLGVETVGDLIVMPRAPLNRRFGDGVLRRLDQALGRTGEPIDPVVAEAMPSARLRLMEPIATAEAIATVIGDLLAMLAEALAARGLGVRRLALICERVDGRREVVRIGTALPHRDPAHLSRLLLPKIETIDPGFGIDAMTLRAVACQPLGATAIHGVLAGERLVPPIAMLVDLIAGRAGTRGLYRVSGLESDVPERSVARVAAIGVEPVPHPEWPRPVRMLDPAEPVQVIAELPDQPPRRFIWRGRPYPVRHGDGPERIHGEWWRRDRAEAVRDYFQVEDESGARFWLYRRGDGVDARTGDLGWYLHGVFA